jgi:inorganic pyrophosphatase
MTIVAPIDLPPTLGRSHLVVVETPRGSGNKIKFEPELGLYRLDRVLPAGMTFPFDFGFIPQTLAADGDPLDTIVLLDSPAYPGCVVEARLLGNLEAQQRAKNGPWERNDRLLAVAEASRVHASVRSIRELDDFLLESIGAFFADYHRLDGEEFRVTRRAGIREAERAIRTAHAAYRDSGAKRGRDAG